MRDPGCGSVGSLRRAVETAGALDAHLVVPPPAGPGVCRCCHGPTRSDFALCFCCAGATGAPGRGPARVVPVSLYRPGGVLHRVLRGYKDGADRSGRPVLAAQVAALASRFLWEHGPCLAPAGWDGLVVVPSTRGRPGPHPLAAALSGTWVAGQLADVLRPAPGPPARPSVGPGADGGRDGTVFEVTDRVAGQHLVLLDDTWTTGARARAAASALAAAGAEVEAVVVLGRIVRPERTPARSAWWASVTAAGRSTRWCCGERRAVAPGAVRTTA